MAEAAPAAIALQLRGPGPAGAALAGLGAPGALPSAARLPLLPRPHAGRRLAAPEAKGVPLADFEGEEAKLAAAKLAAAAIGPAAGDARLVLLLLLLLARSAAAKVFGERWPSDAGPRGTMGSGGGTTAGGICCCCNPGERGACCCCCWGCGERGAGCGCAGERGCREGDCTTGCCGGRAGGAERPVAPAAMRWPRDVRTAGSAAMAAVKSQPSAPAAAVASAARGLVSVPGTAAASGTMGRGRGAGRAAGWLWGDPCCASPGPEWAAAFPGCPLCGSAGAGVSPLGKLGLVSCAFSSACLPRASTSA